MKKIMLVLAGCLSLGLASCSKMPSECQKTWENIEKVAKSSGIPDEALKTQKKALCTEKIRGHRIRPRMWEKKDCIATFN